MIFPINVAVCPARGGGAFGHAEMLIDV